LRECPKSPDAQAARKETAGERDAIEEHLAAARVALDRGDPGAARRHLQELRRIWPDEPRVVALGREIDVRDAAMQRARRRRLIAAVSIAVVAILAVAIGMGIRSGRERQVREHPRSGIVDLTPQSPAASPTRRISPGTRAGEQATFEIAPGVRMDFVWIPAGTFRMGSPASEHEVRITKGFWMGKYEVTQEQWQGVMGSNPSRFTGNGRLPVERVSWNDVQGFIGKLRGPGYRLPTEAEWEYACRAGTTTPFNTGNCLSTSQANYNGNYPYSGCSRGEYRQKTTQVGSFAANAWGLYDMHGNVWEWCSDWYGENYYASSPRDDPRGPSSGTARVLRGGSWSHFAQSCRSAYRYRYTPDARRYSYGFRLTRTAD